MDIDKDQLIKWALIAVGAYLVWEYVLAPMMNLNTTTAAGGGTAPGTTTGTANTTAPGAPAQPQPGPGASTSTAPSNANPPTVTTDKSGMGANGYPSWMQSLDALAAQMVSMAGGVTALDVDQWAYYYDSLRGQRGMQPLTGAEVESIITSFGFNTQDNTRLTNISASQFTTAIFNLGLGLQGIGAIINLPPSGKMAMSFGGGVGSAMGKGFRGFGGKGVN